MGLETFVGTFIDGLNPSNPIGATDPKSEGDDHIRGIKLVLQNTFPNISAAVNSTAAELNVLDGFTGNVDDLNAIDFARGASGDKMLFMQASAPTNWTIDTTFDGRALFVKGTFNGTARAGGDVAGTDDPGIMDVVPSHTHAFTSNSTVTGGGGSHFHTIALDDTGTGGDNRPRASSLPYTGTASAVTNTVGNHTHGVTVSGTTFANGSATDWVPKFACAIACYRTP